MQYCIYRCIRYVKSCSLIHEPNRTTKTEGLLKVSKPSKINCVCTLPYEILPTPKPTIILLRVSFGRFTRSLCIELGQLLANVGKRLPWWFRVENDSWWFRNPAWKPVEVGTLCRCLLQGLMFFISFIHPRILSGFLKHQQYEQCPCFQHEEGYPLKK